MVSFTWRSDTRRCSVTSESEGEEASEEEADEDPCWLISSTTKPKPQPHQVNQATKPISPQDHQLHRENGARITIQNGSNDESKSEDDMERNLHSAVRSCVNPDTFNDILRLAGQNSSNSGHVRPSVGKLWRKGSLDSTDVGGGGISGAQARKSSAPESASTEPVVLRLLIRWKALSY